MSISLKLVAVPLLVVALTSLTDGKPVSSDAPVDPVSKLMTIPGKVLQLGRKFVDTVLTGKPRENEKPFEQLDPLTGLMKIPGAIIGIGQHVVDKILTGQVKKDP